MATIAYNNQSNRVGQIISVGDFVPTRFSAYLRKIGRNYRDYFVIDNSVIIDSTNFKNIEWGNNKVYLNDIDDSFTGNGYMQYYDNSGSTYSQLKYPIATEEPGGHTLWLKLLNNNLAYDIDIYLNDDLVSNINGVMAAGWRWVNADIVIPDNTVYNLGIALKSNGLCLDKIYIGSDTSDPNINEPDYTLSPYITSHFQIYDVNDSFIPINRLDIYDYKNSIEHIKYDDWQNFLINNLNVNSSERFNNNYYAAILSTSGGSTDNIIIWDVVEADYDPYDPYDILPAIFKTI